MPKLHAQWESWPFFDGFPLNVKISCETRWILRRISGSSILVFRSLWVRFAFSVFNNWMRLKLVTYVISSMTLLNVSVIPGIATIRIGSRADVSAGCHGSGVVWISMRRRGTECCLHDGYIPDPSPMSPGMSFCALFTHSSRVIAQKIDRGNPITTFAVSSLHIIAAATKVNILRRPISSATCAPGISESQAHLFTMEHGPLLIGELNGHSAAWLPHQDTHVQIRCWSCCE